MLEAIRLSDKIDREVRRESVVAVYLSSNAPTKSIHDNLSSSSSFEKSRPSGRSSRVWLLQEQAWRQRASPIRSTTTTERGRERERLPGESREDAWQQNLTWWEPMHCQNEGAIRNFFCLKLEGTNHHPEIFRGVYRVRHPITTCHGQIRKT